MIRGIEFYILVWILVTFGIVGFRHLTGKEKWALTKAIAFGAFTAVVALFAVIGIVIIF